MTKLRTLIGITSLLLGLALSACAAPTATPTPLPPTATPTAVLPDTPTPEAEATTPPGGPEVALSLAEKPAEDVLATVNGEAVTWADYEPELRRTLYMVSQQFSMDWNSAEDQAFLPTLQEQTLRQVAARTLMRQLAEESGVSVTQEELDKSLEEERTAILGQGQYPDWETFLKVNGLTDDYFHRLVKDSMLVERLTEQRSPDRTVEQAHVRHILVKTEEEAQEVLEKLRSGTDFAEVASQHSTDTGSKEQGGDLGWFPKGVMVPEFEEAAFSLAVGEISEPVQTQFGYHILEVLERGPRELDDQAYAQAQQDAFTEWFSQEFEGADITYQVHFIPEEELTPEPSATETTEE